MLSRRHEELSDEDYHRFRSLISTRFGLEFPPERRADLAHRLQEAMRRAGHPTMADFFLALVRSPQSPDTEHLATALTVGETGFFRNRPQFGGLVTAVLPRLIEEQRNTRRLRLWSCGCSTGEEPYSLAMALDSLLPDLSQWQIEILATDLNQEALRRAREGRYGEWSFREMDEPLRGRYFTQQGERWVLDPRIRRMVEFRPLNLADDWYAGIDTTAGSMDLILCRNVTIYFAESLTRRVIAKLHDALRPGGWLLVGASEPNMSTYRKFVPHHINGAIFYQRPDLPPQHLTGQAPLSPPPAETPWKRPVIPPPQDAVPLTPPSSLAAYEQAQSLLGKGQSGAAIVALQAQIQQTPQHPGSHLLLAQIHADRGDLEQAERMAERAVLLAPVEPKSYHLLALIRQEQGREEEAIDAMKRALFLDRNDAAAHWRIGVLYRRTGRNALARRAWANAAALLTQLPAEAVPQGFGGATASEILARMSSAYAEGGGP